MDAAVVKLGETASPTPSRLRPIRYGQHGTSINGKELNAVAGGVHITYTWYMRDRRKDLDNVAFAKKFINDGLVLAGVLAGDGQQHIAGFSDVFCIDAARPRIELSIDGLESRGSG